MAKLTSSDQLKVIAGLAIQPFLVAVLAFVLFPFLLLDRSGHTFAGGSPQSVNDAAISVALGAAMVAVVVSLLVGLPLAVWRINRISRGPIAWGESLLIGIALGSAPLLIGTVFGGSYGTAAFVQSFVFAGLLGGAGALAFWAIALRRISSAR